MVPYVFHGQLA